MHFFFYKIDGLSNSKIIILVTYKFTIGCIVIGFYCRVFPWLFKVDWKLHHVKYIIQNLKKNLLENITVLYTLRMRQKTQEYRY